MSSCPFACAEIGRTRRSAAGQTIQISKAQKKEPLALRKECQGLSVEAGDVVLSHPVSRAVPSALRGLTTVFGMGTGVSLAL
jgi:hypothetical protein